MKQIYDWLSELFPDKRHSRTLLLVLLACAFYPFYLLTLYMADKGFYAYEAFSSIFGLVIPFLLMAFVFGIVLLLFAGLFWGGALAALAIVLGGARSARAGSEGTPAAESTEPVHAGGLTAEDKKSLKGAAGIVAFNVVMLAAFGFAIYGSDAGEATRFLKGVLIGSLVLGLVLVVIQATPPAARFTLYAVLFAAGLFVPMFAREQTTAAVEATLAQFRLGGVLVTVAPNAAPLDGPGTGLRGRLVLLSSSNLYLEAGCPRRFLIVPRQPSMRLEFAEIRTAALKEFDCPPAAGRP
ncbi:MAG: hypothetical protein L6Q72_10980 [Burkholderiaceae bacterium]|nr:hypothetical protein [Burkholderiaceae bacterium]